jgi:aminopeptidase N
MHRKTLLATLACASSLACPAMSRAQTREVLPTDVVPLHYDLAIRPDLAEHRFTGTNAITLEVKQSTAEITLNAKDLGFDGAVLDEGTRKPVAIPADAISLDKALDRATLHLPKPVAPGQHLLTIRYHGAIGRDTLGIFSMDYQSADGPRSMLGTNLEPASAREVFPGWDEPGIKASYTVTVDAPAGQMALSNMPVARTVALSPDMNRVTFAQSPRMASYLFFLGMGDLERIHRQVDGVDVGVVVKRGDTAKGAYALDQAAALLHFYNGWFGTPYPLPKLDLIAAPGSLQGDSMENWGAIFYSQTSLLFDPASSTEADRQRVFAIVSHEMAHQWFGDLVTMQWWDNLWLNEGFARWMQIHAADVLHPEWKTGLKAQTFFENGRDADAQPSAHAILKQITTANQAAQAFDDITYDKGAAVITMLADDMGADAFRTGVQRYMRAHAYGSTVDADLWSVMQEVAGKPILAIEHDFTTQPGVPLIRVSATKQGLHLAQDSFRSAGPGAGGEAAHWRIPLSVAPLNGTPSSLMLDGEADVPVKGLALVNAGQSAYARVLYPQPMFTALLNKVPAMSAVDQIGLMQDAQALGNSGYGPGSNALAVVAHLSPSAEPVVWQRAAEVLTGLDEAYEAGAARKAFRAYAIGLIRPVLAGLDKRPASAGAANDAITRARLVEALGQLGDAETLAHARAVFTSGSGSAAEQRSALTVAAAKADRRFFKELLTRARATADPLDKLTLYNALVTAENPAFAKTIANIVLSNEVPAGTNEGLLGRFAAAQPDLAWKLTVPRLGEPGAGLDPKVQWDVAMNIASQASDLSRIVQYRAYMAASVPQDAQAGMLGAIASIELNNKVATQVLADVDRWVAAQGG